MTTVKKTDKVAIPKALRDAGFDTPEAILAASVEDLTAVEGIGVKTVQRLLDEIKGKPDPKVVGVPEKPGKENWHATRVLVLKWYEGDQQYKCSLNIGEPLPDAVPQELIDELLAKRQIQRGAVDVEQAARIHRVEIKKQQ